MALQNFSWRSVFLVAAWLTLAAGCVRLPDTGVTLLKSKTLSGLQGDLLSRKADLRQFRLRGPFAVAVQEDYEITLSPKEIINTDLFLSAQAEKAPLVIFLHGYDNSKEDHSYQAMHVASWGMHCLVVDLPNKGPWIQNGKTLAKLVNFINRWPDIVDNRIDVNKIILVGHSFGGAAVSVALGEGAPAIGGILLDPATISRDLPTYLARINKPVLLIGADERVYPARNRSSFYRNIRGGISEFSIKDATHEDAQFPSHYVLSSEELQVTFVSAITAGALSLSSTGGFDYAWSSFGDALENGKFFNAKRK